MRFERCAAALLIFMLAACAPKPPAVPPPAQPEPMLTHTPQAPETIVLPKPVIAAKTEILRFAHAGALTSLAGIASRNESFSSNFGGQPHREFWDLMRRTGLDPNVKLRELFETTPGRRDVDGVTWYVWPDLAAREAEDLIPERLSFEDRKRLEDLVGEDGIARIRAGEGYPGMQTAIAADGTWVYYILGLDGES